MDFFTALIPLVGIIATFLSLTIIFYTFFHTRNRERLALIAKDKDSSIWHKKRNKKSSLKFAILMVAFGIGAVVGFSLVEMNILSEEVTILGIIPIFLGIGLLVFHWIDQDQEYFDDQV
jgi:cadmium resistance protein CadD (predicted permease)